VPSPDTNREMSAAAVPLTVVPSPDETWHRALLGDGPERERAAAQLHALLLRAARFEVARRREALPFLGAAELDELAREAAADAGVALLRRLGEFRGESRFTTWAYKFALLEAAAKVRRRAWRDRELPVEPEGWERFEDPSPDPEDRAQRAALLAAIWEGLKALTPQQREVLVACAVNGVPVMPEGAAP